MNLKKCILIQNLKYDYEKNQNNELEVYFGYLKKKDGMDIEVENVIFMEFEIV